MKPDTSGIEIAWRASPNHGPRKSEGPIDILLLHYTGMPSAESAIDWLCDPESGVSCHYLVDEAGRTTQMVAEDRRAWHAGKSFWQGETDINSRSVGIEIANPGHFEGYPDFPDVQVRAVIALSRAICARHGIPPARVLAHSDVAPGRKIDPGEKFPWSRLAGDGIGLWIEPEPPAGGRFFQEGDSGAPVEALQAMLALYGYAIEPTGTFDSTTREIVTAFQRHFRPAQVDGVADASTIETLHKLLQQCGPADTADRDAP